MAVVEPSWTDFHVSYRVGSRHPLHQGAAGKAILLGRDAAPDHAVEVTDGRAAGRRPRAGGAGARGRRPARPASASSPSASSTSTRPSGALVLRGGRRASRACLSLGTSSAGSRPAAAPGRGPGWRARSRSSCARSPGRSSTRSMTRCRSVLERATTRAHMSPAPVIVCASSTSGMAARCAPTGSWPPLGGVLADLQGQERRHRVAERLGERSGPQPVITPALDAACRAGPARCPGPPPSRRDASSTPIRGSVREQVDQPAVEIVHRRLRDWTSCTVIRRTVAHSARAAAG